MDLVLPDIPAFALPAIPAGLTILLNFFAPYAVAIVVDPAWPAKVKKLVAVVVAILLALVVIAVAFLVFGIPVPSWPVLVVLAVLTSQASYDLILKKSADTLALSAGTGKHVA